MRRIAFIHTITEKYGGRLMDTIKHGMSGYRIPAYMEEILTHNYCPNFIRMTIVRDGQSYRFSYRPGRLTRLKTEDLDVYEMLMLIRSIIAVCETTQGFLIGAENYLLEPELIYTEGGTLTAGKLRIMFYPDMRRIRLPQKLLQFTDRLSSGLGKEERTLLAQLRDILETEDINRAKMFLDKHIVRIESRSFGKAV